MDTHSSVMAFPYEASLTTATTTMQQLTEVWHIAHFWVSYGRCAMPGLPMGWSEVLSRQWED